MSRTHAEKNSVVYGFDKIELTHLDPTKTLCENSQLERIRVSNDSNRHILKQVKNEIKLEENQDVDLIPWEENISNENKEEIKTTPKKIILNNLIFKTGEATLIESTIQEIDKVVQILKSKPTLKAQIVGHTDYIGTEEDNLVLSMRRAKAVENYLIEKGISKDRLNSAGRGESEPISKGNDNESLKMNRRVEIEFY